MKLFLPILLSFFVQFLFAQKVTSHIPQDSVFTSSGDTLIGKITIDKDHNQYIFNAQAKDSLNLMPTKIKRFILFSKENNEERQVYDMVFNDFYFLELGEQDIITLYAKHTYSKVVDDGPTYYTTKKKYCLFKNKILYNIKPETLKADLLVLTAECSTVSKKIRDERKIRIEDLASIITLYNHCFDKK